jgi:hypothetical protein
MARPELGKEVGVVDLMVPWLDLGYRRNEDDEAELVVAVIWRGAAGIGGLSARRRSTVGFSSTRFAWLGGGEKEERGGRWERMRTRVAAVRAR